MVAQQLPVRWSGRNGHGESNFPLSWKQQDQPANGHEPSYDAAFRVEAVRRVTQDGQAATRVAQALGMSEALLGRWVRAARAQATRPAGSEALE